MEATKKTTKKAPAKAESKPKSAPKIKETKPVEKDGAFAVIETGGKQYRVSVGDAIKIEKVKSEVKEYKEGDSLIFNKVILVDNGVDATDVGTPFIEGAQVSGIITEIGRNAKVTVIKYKQKSRYFKKNGHRQPFFKVKIEKIS